MSTDDFIVFGVLICMGVHGVFGNLLRGGVAESSDGKKKKTNPQFVKSDCLVSIEIMVSLSLADRGFLCG